MSQYTLGTINTTTTDGDGLATDLENLEAALQSQNSGSTAPSYAIAGTTWRDTTADPHLIKLYDGADWITIGALGVASNTWVPYQGQAPLKFTPNAADTGIANAYAMAPVPALDAYRAGQVFFLKPANANTGACTANISAKGALSIKMQDGSDPPANALLTTGVYMLFYTGTVLLLMNPSTTNVLLFKGTTIASGATVDLGAADSDFIDVSGSGTVTSLGSTVGRNHVWTRFTGACTLTYDPTQLILPGAANIVTAAGDVAEWIRITAGNWVCVGYTKANGQPLVSTSGGQLWANATVAEAGGQIVPTQGAYSTMPFNTTGYNTITGANHTSGVITLPVGKYSIDARATLSDFASTQGTGGKLRLRDTTNGVTLLVGDDVEPWLSTNCTDMSLQGFFTVSSAINVEVQYYMAVTGAPRIGRCQMSTGETNNVVASAIFRKEG